MPTSSGWCMGIESLSKSHDLSLFPSSDEENNNHAESMVNAAIKNRYLLMPVSGFSRRDPIRFRNIIE